MKNYAKAWFGALYNTRFVGARAAPVGKRIHLCVLLGVEAGTKRERERERESFVFAAPFIYYLVTPPSNH